MTRMFAGPGCVLDDGPCNNCGHCHDEDDPVTMMAEDMDAEQGDIKRAAEPDERCDLSCDDDRPDYLCPFRAKYGYCYEDKLQEIRKGVVE